MTYTFWHGGVLIGESDLERASDTPLHRGGVFRPTAYGLELFPRLTGILSAGHALKAQFDADGLSPEEMPCGEIERLFASTPAGRTFMGYARTLSQVEVRAPDGRRLECLSIAFSDAQELQRLARELEIETDVDLAGLPADVPSYVVSTIFLDHARSRARTAQASAFAHRHWSSDN